MSRPLAFNAGRPATNLSAPRMSMRLSVMIASQLANAVIKVKP
jgi:hypothetical protein